MGNRRSRLLVLATWLANIFVFGFTADAVLSVLDEALTMAFDGQVIADARNAVALAVATASLPALLLVIFVPQLPRAVLVPLIVFLIWAAFGAPPLSAPAASSWLPALAFGQLLLAANAFRIIHHKTGRWWLVADRLPTIDHFWRRTIVALVVTSVLGCVSLAGLMAASVASYIETMTGGYLQFSWTGIEVRETVLKRGNTSVYLVATTHVADPQFYKTIHGRIPGDALVFVEGVSDRSGRMRGLSYGNVARAFGLTTQDTFNTLLGPVEADDEGAEPPADGDEPARSAPQAIRADVDAEVFSERAIEFLHEVAVVNDSASLRQALARMAAFNQKFTNEEVNSIFDELLDQRNAHLLEAFDRRVADYDKVFIPWGAAHMPGLQTGLKARNFHVVSERSTPVARYDSILRHVFR